MLGFFVVQRCSAVKSGRGSGRRSIVTNELEGRRRSRERDNDRLHVGPEAIEWHKKSENRKKSRKF